MEERILTIEQQIESFIKRNVKEFDFNERGSNFKADSVDTIFIQTDGTDEDILKFRGQIRLYVFNKECGSLISHKYSINNGTAKIDYRRGDKILKDVDRIISVTKL